MKWAWRMEAVDLVSIDASLLAALSPRLQLACLLVLEVTIELPRQARDRRVDNRERNTK